MTRGVKTKECRKCGNKTWDNYTTNSTICKRHLIKENISNKYLHKHWLYIQNKMLSSYNNSCS